MTNSNGTRIVKLEDSKFNKSASPQNVKPSSSPSQGVKVPVQALKSSGSPARSSNSKTIESSCQGQKRAHSIDKSCTNSTDLNARLPSAAKLPRISKKKTLNAQIIKEEVKEEAMDTSTQVKKPTPLSEIKPITAIDLDRKVDFSARIPLLKNPPTKEVTVTTSSLTTKVQQQQTTFSSAGKRSPPQQHNNFQHSHRNVHHHANPHTKVAPTMEPGTHAFMPAVAVKPVVNVPTSVRIIFVL